MATTDRVTAVSAVGHLAIGALSVWVATEHAGDPDEAAWWGLAAFSALGLVATLLGWASAKAGNVVWQAGVAVLLVSLGVLVWLISQQAAMLAIAGCLLFCDWLLFANARRELNAR
jgi:hypothetical protein